MRSKFQINDEIIKNVIEIAKNAGTEIMNVYDSDFDVYIKSDKSPVTDADKRAHDIITKGLLNITPNIPILSEEGRNIPYNVRSKWESFWLVDPLDGTKEYIKKNNEFTVNIAFLKDNNPEFGVVFAPALNELYWGWLKTGAFKSIAGKPSTSIKVKTNLTNPIQIAASRSHPSPKMDEFLSQFEKINLNKMGSSLKLCSVADGKVHFYPRLGPTMEWDTAASHAIILAAGGDIIKYGTNIALEYNKENLLNPEFIAGNVKSINALN